jgi:cysteinyl-tRNA synthetase
MRLKNSTTSKIEEIKLGKEFNMYVCGPTVYNYMHIGNARPIVTYDLLNRLLTYKNIKVNFVHNITDIDDKIIQKAIDEKTTESNIAKKYTKSYNDDLKTLNIKQPTSMPTVTENLDVIIETIDKLIKLDMAYEKDGNIFFKVSKLKEYGEISNVDVSNLQNEDNNLNKENTEDFTL